MLLQECFPRITGASPLITPSPKDLGMLIERTREWIEGFETSTIREGEFVRFSDGVMHRVSHVWGDGAQTSPAGSFYFHGPCCEFSGALDPIVRNEHITKTSEFMLGCVWFFHDNFPRAHSAVYAEIPCRVFAVNLPSPK